VTLFKILKEFALKQTQFHTSTKKDFKNKYTIRVYSIGLSDQSQSILVAKCNIILQADISKAISAPTGTDEGIIFYAVIVSKAIFRYEPNKNVIIQEF